MEAIMSSPVHHPTDLDAALTYAPPWVRADGRAATLVPDAAKIEWPPQSHRSAARPFSGDVAVRELQRQVSLHPERVPQPVPVKHNRSGIKLALRICGTIGIAALGAWAVVSIPLLRQTGNEAGAATSSVAALVVGRTKHDHFVAGVPPRLLVHDGRAQANESMPAGIELEGNQPGTTITLSGLAADARLSAGSALEAGFWRVNATELADLQIQPPHDFVGTMNVKADLRLADDQLADSQLIHFDWTRPAEAPPKVEPPQTPAQPDAVALHLDEAETAMLLKRGHEFLKNGDFVSARLLLARAAAAGSGDGALALGQTFDPSVIQQLGAVGVKPDAAKARDWYQKALLLGSDAASQQLAKLAQATE
jgi:hypothetical protein